jgi:hypothetical protein
MTTDIAALQELDGYPVDVKLRDGRHLAGNLHVVDEVVTLTPCDGLPDSVSEPIGLLPRLLAAVFIRQAAPA